MYQSNWKMNSYQKKLYKKKHNEEALQKIKHRIINQYYDIIEEQQYQTPYLTPWNNTIIVVGIWNDKEKKIEFTDHLIKNLDQEIQILSNPVE